MNRRPTLLTSLWQVMFGAAVLALGACHDERLVAPIAAPDQALRNVDASTAAMTVRLVFNSTLLRDQKVTFTGSCPFGLYRDATPSEPYGKYVTSICSSEPLLLTGQPTGPHTYQLLFNGPEPSPLPSGVASLASTVATNFIAGESAEQDFELNGTMALLTGTLTVNGSAPGGRYVVCNTTSYSLYPCVMPDASGAFALVDFAGDRKLSVRGAYTYGIAAATVQATAAAGATQDLGAVSVESGAMAVDLKYHDQLLRDQGIVFTQYCFMYMYVDPPALPNAPSPIQALCSDPGVLDGMPTGTHTYELRFWPSRPGESYASVAKIDAAVPAGAASHHAFELSGAMGLVTGRLLEDGKVPTPDTYVVCNATLQANAPCTVPDNTTGVFKLLDVSGDRVAIVRKRTEYTGGQPFTYTIETGKATDLGDVNVAATSVTLEVRYDDHLLRDAGVVFTQYCQFSLYRDPTPTNIYGTWVKSLCPWESADKIVVTGVPPGQHTFELRFNGPPATQYTSNPVVASATLTLVGGTPATEKLELKGTMGLVTGTLTINGHAPGTGYLLCTGSFNYNNPCVEADAVSGAFKFIDIAGARLGIVRTYNSYAPTSTFGYTAVAGETTVVGTTTGGAAGSTPVGTAVNVTPVDAATGTTPATLVFAQVTGNGLTTVSTSPTGPPPPPRMQLGRPTFYYNIATSATFTGKVTICINYAATTFSNPAKAQLLHGDGKGGWTNITTTHDLVNHVICGETTTLSPFVIAEPDNAPPVAAAGGPYAADEGSMIAFDGSGSSDPDKDVITYAWDLGDGTTSADVKPSHAYVNNGTYTVTLTVSDPSGLTNSASSTVTVANVAPRVTVGTDASIFSGDSYAFTGGFSDPGTADAPWSYRLEFGEGVPIADQTVSQSSAITGSHQYFKVGAYTVRLAVTDKDGGTGSGSLALTVKRIPVGLSIFPFLATLPQAPVIYDPLMPQRSTPVVVALLGSASFPVANPVTRAPRVDGATVRLGRTPLAMLLGRYVMAVVDVNRDGVLDLLLTFPTDKLVANGDLSSGVTTPQAVVVTGDHADGRQFTASGQITVRQKPPERVDH